MASFNSTIITEKGHALMSKIVAGTASPNFTKISVSDYQYPVGTDFEALTAMTSVKQTTLVSSVSKVNDAAVKVSGVLSNAALGTGYYLRAIGLYAMDPNEGEILYSITSAIQPDWIPPNNGISASSVMIDLITVVSNASNVSLEVDPNAVATIEQLEAIPQKSFYADIEAYYGNVKTIDDFQSDGSDWTYGGNPDTTNVKIGKQSWNFNGYGNKPFIMDSFNNGEPITGDDYLIIVGFAKPSVNQQYLVSFLTSSDETVKSYSFIATENEWYYGKFKLNLTQDQIDSIAKVKVVQGSSMVDFSWQLIQLVKKDPAEDYPNPFQKHGVRELEINSNEWFVGKEFGEIKVIPLTTNDSHASLAGDLSFYNFTMNGKVRIRHTTSDVNSYGGWYASGHYIIFRHYTGSNKIELRISDVDGVRNVSNGDIPLNKGDIVEYTLTKDEGNVNLTAYVNYDYSTPYKVNTTINTTREGNLAISTFTSRELDYLSASITELTHAHHADISETAKSIIEQPKARIYQSAGGQSIPDSVNENLVYDAVEYDNRNHFDENDPEFLTIRETGLYLITATLAYAGVGGNKRVLGIEKNDVTVRGSLQTIPPISGNNYINITVQEWLKVGDKINAYTYQDSGSAITTVITHTKLEVIKIN